MIKLKNISEDEITLFGQVIFPNEEYELQSFEHHWLDEDIVKSAISNQLISVISSIVSPRQLRLALLANSITNQAVEDAIAQLDEPDRSAAQIGWEYSIEFDLNNPIALAIGALLGLTEEQMNDIWELAITL